MCSDLLLTSIELMTVCPMISLCSSASLQKGTLCLYIKHKTASSNIYSWRSPNCSRNANRRRRLKRKISDYLNCMKSNIATAVEAQVFGFESLINNLTEQSKTVNSVSSVVPKRETRTRQASSERKTERIASSQNKAKHGFLERC